MQDRNVVIVDSYSSTNMGRSNLVQKFKDIGVSCVRVQSSTELPIILNLPGNLADYLDNIVNDGDFEKTVEAVSRHNPIAVIAGSEVAVEFADRLSERLGVPSNGTARSVARRDKFVMIEAIREAGLNATTQIKIENADHVRDWHLELGGRVVLKPVRGANGCSIRFCDTVEQSVDAYNEIMNSGNFYTARNEAVVAQEYLGGTEFMVNTVSSNGKHHVCDIWQTNRLTANGLLDLCGSVNILPIDRRPADELIDYSFRALDALDIRHGAAHIEIRMTPKGPYLVEIGARAAGGDLPYNATLATGESQLDWIVDAYARPERFEARYSEPYRVKNYYATVGMVSPYEGTLVGYARLDELKALESLHEIRVVVKPGEKIQKTVDDLSYPILINLMHPVEEVVLRDAETIRYVDGTDFYLVEEKSLT